MKIELKVIKSIKLQGQSNRRWQLLASSSLVAAALVAAPGTGFAQATNWTAGAGDYATGGNWDNGVPVAGGTASIDVGAGAAVTVSTAGNETGSLTQKQGTFTVTGGGALNVTTASGGVGMVVFENMPTVSIAGTLTATNTIAAYRDPSILPGSYATPMTVSVSGTMTAATVNAGNGTGTNVQLVVASGGALNAAVNINGDAGDTRVTVANNGSLTGNVTVTSGRLVVGGTVTGAVNVLAGAGPGNGNEVIVDSTGVVTGLVTLNERTGVRSSGNLSGGLTMNDGYAEISGGTVSGPVNMTQSAVMDLAAAATLSGPVTLNGPGVVLNASGNLSNGLTITNGIANFSNGSTVTGDVTNSGELNTGTGGFAVTGTLTNTATGLISIANGQTLTAPTINNSGFISIGSSTTAGITGNLIGSGSSTLNLNNGTLGDTLTITGNMSGTNRLLMNTNLSATNGGVADQITVTGQLSGSLTFDMNASGVNGSVFSLQTTPIVLIDAATLDPALTDADLTLGGLPQSQGLVIYDLAVDAANTNVVLRSEINPAVGDVAAAMSSISSLIGTVINRPSGAFVSGIAFDTPNNCSTGSWARLQGGRIAADARTRNVTANTGKNTSAGITEFMGLQGGIDFGCFEDINGGWDVSGGVLLGANTGWFSQSSTGASLTRGDFEQKFIGAYVAASRGNWSGEIQIRYEDGDLMFNNPVMSLRNAEASFKSTAMSGSLTYRHSLGMGWSLLPTVGFAVSNNKVSALTFTDNTGAAVGSMKIEDKTNKTAFVGATLGKTIIDVANASASSHFVTATYYADITGNRASTFTTAGALGPIANNTLSTDEIGDFGEVSVGTSYVKVINGNPGSIRQVNASVRTDVRFGGDVQGAGLTAQVRLQF